MKVSIIVPVYKVEKYLRECLDSIVNQTYTDLEIILVDDGSPDTCGDICEEYAAKDDRITVIHKENGGQADARNVGLKVSQGEYIYFLDSDDYVELNTIKELVQLAEQSQPDIVFFKAVTFSDDPDLQVIPIKIEHDYQPNSGSVILSQRYTNHEWTPGVQMHFFKAAFLKNEDISFHKGIIYEDLLFSCIAYVRAKKVCVLNRALCHYRTRHGSTMNSKPGVWNLNCYAACIDELQKEKQRYAETSAECKAVDTILVDTSRVFLNMYCEVDRADRKAAAASVRKIRKALDRVNCVVCRKEKIKYSCPKLWCCYRKVKRAIKRG